MYVNNESGVTRLFLYQIKIYSDLNLPILRVLLSKEKRQLSLTTAQANQSNIFSLGTPLPPAMFAGYVDSDDKLKTTIANLKVIIKINII